METESSTPKSPFQRQRPRAFFNIALNLLPLLGVWLFDFQVRAVQPVSSQVGPR
jgi:hypothetical protein